MFDKIAELLTHAGVTRDDQKWFWLQVLAVAGVIASGSLDLNAVAGYLGLHPSETTLHWITAASTAVLWFAGNMKTSPLFGKANLPPQFKDTPKE